MKPHFLGDAYLLDIGRGANLAQRFAYELLRTPSRRSSENAPYADFIAGTSTHRPSRKFLYEILHNPTCITPPVSGRRMAHFPARIPMKLLEGMGVLRGIMC
jgi:hypothetical protein